MSFPGAPEILKTEEKSLSFRDEAQQARFELGVASALFLWADLRAAVENSWGGPESEQKREWMVGAVIDLFESDEVAVEDVEDRLLAMLEDEFDVILETGTTADVARQVMGIYQAVSDKSYQQIDELYKHFLELGSSKVEVHIAADGNSDDDEESDDGHGEDAMELENTVGLSKPEPVVDEDGFELVQRRKR